MKRRSIISLASGVTLCAALPASAQTSPKVYRIGFLAVRSRSTPRNPDVYYDTIVRAMRDLGYVERPCTDTQDPATDRHLHR